MCGAHTNGFRVLEASQSKVICLGFEPTTVGWKCDNILFKGVEEARIELLITPKHLLPDLQRKPSTIDKGQAQG